ncbi:hypothetical protein B834_1355 [Enterococcus mundtii 1A]|uniref:hypothetical protein n=1 Tax=Enterococcus TaxID=1350 RepID=UPI002303FD66|nr:hypothetical protein [Enterococcus mundtii]MDA9428868.1 hypothetical protein [Enterococcus mundtii 1A]
MTERQSKLFPNKKSRPKTNGMKDMEEFTKSLSIASSNKPVQKTNIQIENNKKLKNPNKSHKGKAGRKAEYKDPRLKKDLNMKISLSTKLRIQRLISRKFDNKSEGDVIDIALDYLVSSFDRDDRDSLYKAYKEDMESMIPIIQEKNEKARKNGKPILEITDEINEQTLKEQKEKWVSAKFE